MRNCLIVGVLGVCALCLTCGVAAPLLVWPRLEAAVSESQDVWTEEMAAALTRSVSAAITRGALRDGELVLHETDLDLGFGQAFLQQPGLPTPPTGTAVYGFVFDVTPAGLSLLMGGPEWAYLGVPVVADGRIDLTRVSAVTPMGLLEWFLSAESFETIVETGLNDALAAHDLVPLSLTLGEGWLTIAIRPARGPSTPTAERVVRTSLDRVKPF